MHVSSTWIDICYPEWRFGVYYCEQPKLWSKCQPVGFAFFTAHQDHGERKWLSRRQPVLLLGVLNDEFVAAFLGSFTVALRGVGSSLKVGGVVPTPVGHIVFSTCTIWLHSMQILNIYNISQGNVATRISRTGIFHDRFIATVLENMSTGKL